MTDDDDDDVDDDDDANNDDDGLLWLIMGKRDNCEAYNTISIA